MTGPVSQRSALIAGLREQLHDNEVTVPLSLSWEDAQAWFACAEGQELAGSVSTACGHQKHDAAADRDDQLLRALKVSSNKRRIPE